jgi:hypothetical protein
LVVGERGGGEKAGGITESTIEKATRLKERTTKGNGRLHSISNPRRFVYAIIYNYFLSRGEHNLGIPNDLGLNLGNNNSALATEGE